MNFNSYQIHSLSFAMATFLARASNICKRRWRNIVRPSTRRSCRSNFRRRLNLKRSLKFKVSLVLINLYYFNFKNNSFKKKQKQKQKQKQHPTLSFHVSNCWQRSRQSIRARCALAVARPVDVERDGRRCVDARVAQFDGASGASNEFDSWL